MLTLKIIGITESLSNNDVTDAETEREEGEEEKEY